MIISLALSLAYAASPSDLEAAIPEAQEALRACAQNETCTRANAAQAAWLVALHRYLADGVADGELAATVQALNPDLFDDLPDVLRRSVTEPREWALALMGEPLPPLAMAMRAGGLEPGFYASFDELAANAPSTSWTSVGATVEELLTRACDLSNPRGKLENIKVFGFSDGERVFVNSSRVSTSLRTACFAEAEIIGPWARLDTVTPFMLMVGSVPLWLSAEETVLLDLRSGRFRNPSRRLLRAELANDPEKLDELANRRPRGEDRIEVLREIYENRP
ncbi:MAG: hypothetical protein AAGA48_03350 [Myxococcota bacterium]